MAAASKDEMEKMIFDELDEIVPIPVGNITGLEPIEHDKLSMVRDDVAFEIITDALTSPSKMNDEDDSTIKRSYRVMKYICDDLDEAEEFLKTKLGKDDDDLYLKYLLNPIRAGLLAKKLFAAYKLVNKSFEENLFEIPLPHLPHLNKTMEALLSAFPSQVVGASCVGGEKGFTSSLGQMLKLHKHVKPERSPLSIVAQIISIGCTGRKNENASLQEQQAAMMGGGTTAEKILINLSHRRKFVHGLTQWGGFKHFVDMIKDDTSCVDDVSEPLLSTVEFISFPQQTLLSMMNGGNGAAKKTTHEESVGEESLLANLASGEIIESLFDCITTATGENAQSEIEAISLTILSLFELATGKARRQAPAALTSQETEQIDDSVECKASDKPKAISPGIDDNKMVKAGVTDKMHAAINERMGSLVGAIDIYMSAEDELDEEEESSEKAIRHPGRYIIQKPFTTKRLHLLTLFTDLVTYESHCESKNDAGPYHCAIEALDKVSDLPLPAGKDDGDLEKGTICNPWPGICDLLFDYPENNMYQYQFYRLIHGLCATNHEKTLKLVVQKCKFLSKAIKICSAKSEPSSARGVLLRCLNALRLHSQSISTHSFLRHYLESHDGWKNFQDELKR
jgi:hypothetical protein